MPINMTFSDILKKHESLAARSKNAQDCRNKVRKAFDSYPLFSDYCTFVYCAGSLGRGDVGCQSDLDLFLVTNKKKEERKYLTEIRLLAHAIDINKKLGYEPFSNDGEFLKVYSLEEMLKTLGSPSDDSENLFTARMLMLLESKCVCNDQIYNKALLRIIDHYFRDSINKQSFNPLYLLNDLLRYWRTLCLNYEQTRGNPDKPWRKKNINLKFSRMLTVFGTVLPIIITKNKSESDIINLVSLSPHERFAQGLDELEDDSLLCDYNKFLNDYELFLSWKEKIGNPDVQSLNELENKLRDSAKSFSDFFYKVATHDDINSEFKKYLVL